MIWPEVVRCFADRRNPVYEIQRLSNHWCERYRIHSPTLGSHCEVVREHWDNHKLGAHLDEMARWAPNIITSMKPRRLKGPIVIVDYGKGRVGQLDGRRRANVWRHIQGTYEVLRICAY
jgi:hypothetical protein